MHLIKCQQIITIIFISESMNNKTSNNFLPAHIYSISVSIQMSNIKKILDI